MRSTTVFTLMTLIATAGVASAQDGFRPMDRETAGGRTVRFQGGIFTDAIDVPATVSGISTTGNPGPDTTAEATTNIDYLIGHRVFGATLGVHVAPPQVAGLEGDLSLLFGGATSSITLDAGEGSALVGTGNPLDDNHQTMADRNGDFVFGVLLRGAYLVRGLVLVGLDYQFLNGSGVISDDVFFNEIVKGDYTFTRHRVALLLGVQQGPVRPYLGLGFLVYESNADLTRGDRITGGDTWDVDFEADHQFRALLGVEFVDRWIGTRVELHLLPALGVTVSVYVRV